MEDEFKPIKVKPYRVCDDFNVVKDEQHGTTSIHIQREDLNTKPWEKYAQLMILLKRNIIIEKLM